MNQLVPETLDDLIREAMEEWQVPGISLAVVGKDQPDCVKAFGWRDVEAGLPVTPDTQFTLCSITKSFTALGLAMLVDDGLPDWEKPVREYLPDFRLHDAIATDRVTVQDLLCHRSGLSRHDWVWMPGTYVRRRASLWSISDTPAGGINATASDMARYMRRRRSSFINPTARSRRNAKRANSGATRPTDCCR